MRRLACVLSASALALGCGDDEKKSTDTRADSADSAADSAGDSAADGTDSAEPDTVPADTAEPDTVADTTEPDTTEPDTAADTDVVTPAADFACLGHDPVYTLGQGAIEYDIVIVDFITQAPIPGVRGRWCDRFDPFCTAPIHESTSDADGIAHVKVPANFDGFVQGDGGGIVPTLQIIDPPIVAKPDTEPEPVNALTPAGLATVAALFDVELDPAAGLVVVAMLDCDLAFAAGVSIVTTDAQAGSVVGYLEGGLPSKTATATDAGGIGGVFNVPPGGHTFTAVTADGAIYGRAGAFVVAGAITLIAITPQQTTPDRSCSGEPERPLGFEGEVTATIHLRDFASLASIGGAHVKVCAADDHACVAPLAEGDSDENGDVLATFAVTAEGFDGFIEVTGGDVFPTHLHFDPPLRVGENPLQTVDLLTTTEADLFAQIAGAELDLELAHLAIAVQDCRFRGSHGVSISVAPTTAKTKVIYVSGGLPAPAATATDDTGIAGVFNVPIDEEVVVTGTFGDELFGKTRITPMKGFLEELNLVPSK